MPYATDDRISTDPIDGGIEISDMQYLAAINAMRDGKFVRIEGGLLVFKDPPPPPEPEVPEPDPDAPKVIAKITVLERMTNEEAEIADQAMATQPAKLRQIWNAVNDIWDNSPWFPTLQEFFAGLFGQERADQLLSFE